MDKVEKPKKKEDMTKCIGGGMTRTQKAIGFNQALQESDAWENYVMQPIDEVCELIKDHNKKKVYGLDDYKVIKSLQRVMWNAIKESKRRREEG